MAIKIKSKNRNIEEIPLASTADIAFLLIIFFLAASALLELKGIKIPLPKKDSPPMQIQKENLFKIEINKNKEFFYNSKKYELLELLQLMEDSNKKNPETVFVIKVDPECPSEIIPIFIYGMQQRKLIKFSLNIK